MKKENGLKMAKRIENVSMLNYNGTLKAFQSSWKRLVINWEKLAVSRNPEWQRNDMLMYAASAGNLSIVKYLIEKNNANPKLKSKIFNKTNYHIEVAMEGYKV